MSERFKTPPFHVFGALCRSDLVVWEKAKES